MSRTTMYTRTAITATARYTRHERQHKERQEQSNKFLATNVTKMLDRYIEGNSPGDMAGGEAYEFNFADDSTFCYVINGLDDCYLLVDGDWYLVSNPSTPPIAEP